MNQPVHVRTDFKNMYIELTEEQIQRLETLLREFEKENADDSNAN